MLGLNATLSMAAQALSAQDAAIGVTNNNIANVNTPGYSRQLVTLSAQALSQNGTSVDAGVSFGGYTSVRDQLLQLGINAKTSQKGSLDAQASALTQMQTAFSSSSTGIDTALSNFFSSVSALSTNPADTSARQAVLSASNQLTNAFHQASAALSGTQSDANASVTSTVAEINSLTQQIATLNGQLAQVTGDGGQGGSIEDQRNQLTTQLAQLTGVQQTSTGQQPTLTTGNGSALVIGGTAYALQITTGGDGQQHVLDASGNDITTSLSGGSLGGALATRDVTVPGLLTQLNTLATQFAEAVNSAQAAGYDATGAAGQPLFSISGTGGASAGLSVALSSASAIAASSDGASGSSGNLTNLLAVQTSALPSGQTASDTYTSLVAQIGSTVSQTTTAQTATTLSLTQLTNQQSAESGVSIDEESTNLIRYQQAYSAAAQVITTVNNLFTVLMNMTANGA